MNSNFPLSPPGIKSTSALLQSPRIKFTGKHTANRSGELTSFEKRKKYDSKKYLESKKDKKENSVSNLNSEFKDNFSALELPELEEAEKIFIKISADDPDNNDVKDILRQIRNAMYKDKEQKPAAAAAISSSSSFKNNDSQNAFSAMSFDGNEDDNNNIDVENEINSLFNQTKKMANSISSIFRPEISDSKCPCDHSREIEVLCNTCQSLICFKCGFISHQGHSVISIEEIAQKERKSLNKKITRMIDKSNEMNKNSVVYSDHARYLNETRWQFTSIIQEKVDALVDLVKERGKQVQNDLDSLLSKRILLLNRTSGVLNVKAENLSKNLESIKYRLNQLNNVQLLLDSNLIEEDLKNLSNENVQNIPINDIKILPGTYDNILSQIPDCIFVVNQDSPDSSLSTAERIQGFSPDGRIEFILTLCNSSGNSILEGLSLFDFKVYQLNKSFPSMRGKHENLIESEFQEHITQSISTEIKDNLDGTYLLSFLPDFTTQESNETKSYMITIKVCGKHVSKSPFYIDNNHMAKTQVTSSTLLFGENVGKVLTVSSEFQVESNNYAAENLMKYSRESAWVTKTCENEFVEVELLNGNGGFYLDRIELINLNARAYKISVNLFNENLNTSMISKEKICKKKSSLPFDWIPLEMTKSLTPTPGDSTAWTIKIKKEESKKIGKVSHIRLDILGNVNMAAFYALNIYGL